MITLSRLLVRQLRSIYRRVGIKLHTHRPIYVVMQSGAAGLTIRARSPDVVVEYHQQGPSAEEQLVVPLEFLSDCEGTKNDPVTLEAHGTDKMVANWTDKNIPQLIEYQSSNPKTRQPFRGLPKH